MGVIKLKRNDNSFKNEIFDKSPIGILFYDKKGKLIDINQSALEIAGMSSLNDFKNLNLFNNPNIALKKEKLLKEGLIKFQAPLNFENTGFHVLKDSKVSFIDWTVSIIGSGFLVQIHDVTDQVEKHSKSEEKYRQWFEDDLTGDFIATIEGKILECNPAFAEIYGFYDCENALKWNISESNPFDWPYIVTRLKKERKIQGFQSWQRRSDGMRIHVIANVVGIFNDSNELIQIKGYVFDDTERKRAEDELARSKIQIKEILDSIKDGFMALNHQWRLIYVNKCARKYFGVEVEDLIEQNLWERFPELTGTTYEKKLRRAMETREIQHFEAQDIHIPYQWFDFSVYPFSEGISVFWRDITKH